MNQEDKKLLLIVLSTMLPYATKVFYEYVDDLDKKTYGYSLTLNTWCIDELISEKAIVKPYLRPISSMTEDEMDRLFDILQIDKDGKDEDWIKINDVYGIKFFFPTGKWIENVAEAYDYLYLIHIDFRGLIHKGLAIEVTEENNPYKE